MFLYIHIISYFILHNIKYGIKERLLKIDFYFIRYNNILLMLLKNMNNDYTPTINYIKYKRLPEIELEYQNHLKYLQGNNITIKDYIMNTVIKNNNMIIVKNNFPYNIVGFKHYLLWIHIEYKPSDLELYNYIKDYVGESDFYYFENSSQCKTVLCVRHLHIFIKI